MPNKSLPLDDSATRFPISVVTGFLGSGKTTLLNSLLKHPLLKKTAVVVNEFGAISIDHLLVRSATEDIIIMEGGCLCCTVRGDLVETLQDLLAKRKHTEVPPFERIVIETSGLADPAPIIHTLIDDPALKNHCHLDSVVTTIDSVYGFQQLDEHYESVKQAAVADRLMLTKTDIADTNTVNKLKQRLHQLNPAAILLTNIDGNIDISQLFSASLYDSSTKNVDVQGWLKAENYTHHHKENVTEKHSSTQHDSYIDSFCIEWDEPLAWKVLNYWFKQLTALRGKDLLRVKGIAYTVETKLPVVVQGVQHIFQSPTTLPAWPKNMQPRTQIVFITRNIPKTVIEEMLRVLIKSKNTIEACAAALILVKHR